MYNILICDDEQDIVNALKIYLQNPDYRLFEAHNGIEAVELVQKEDIHLISHEVMGPDAMIFVFGLLEYKMETEVAPDVAVIEK